MKTAAKISKNEFKNFLQTEYSIKHYPSPDDVEKLGWVPKYLKLFLSLLIKSELKAGLLVSVSCNLQCPG